MVIEDFKLKEALAYCKECQKGYIRYFSQLDEQSEEYFFEVGKFLVEYYASSKFENYSVIINICSND